MERTESTVIQVAPDYENAMIKEMEQFGWSLQGRQEIHQEGDAYGRPSLLGGDYIITFKVHQYVKLHFIRSVNLPHLDQIRRLEKEYFNFPQPTFPWPHKGSLAYYFMVLSPPLLIYYFLVYRKKEAAAREQLEEARRRRAAIAQEVAKLLQTT